MYRRRLDLTCFFQNGFLENRAALRGDEAASLHSCPGPSPHHRIPCSTQTQNIHHESLCQLLHLIESNVYGRLSVDRGELQRSNECATIQPSVWPQRGFEGRCGDKPDVRTRT